MIISKKELACKRLGDNKANNTYKLTIPPSVIENNKWEVGQTLYFKKF